MSWLEEGPVRRKLRELFESHPFRSQLVEEEFPFEPGSRLCGGWLERWLMDKGLTYLDAKDILVGIPDFKSTTIALDVNGRIVDYDQYYQNASTVQAQLGKAIKSRIRKKPMAFVPHRLIYFTNIPPDCLEFAAWDII